MTLVIIQIAVPAGDVYHLTECASPPKQPFWCPSLRRTCPSTHRPTDATVARSMVCHFQGCSCRGQLQTTFDGTQAARRVDVDERCLERVARCFRTGLDSGVPFRSS